MLVIKTGMSSEFNLVKPLASPAVLVLTGTETVQDLRKAVPSYATAIISVGLCGGLAPNINVGDIVLASKIATPVGTWAADSEWNRRLRACTGARIVPWWSSSTFNTANTQAQRDALCKTTGCDAIDDETFAVAQFAVERNIPFTAMRAVSDGEKDNLPSAVTDAVNADGTDNLWAVIESVCTNPFQIPALIKTAFEYEKSLDSLSRACRQVGPDFQWNK